jgi:hypothetical protein
MSQVRGSVDSSSVAISGAALFHGVRSSSAVSGCLQDAILTSQSNLVRAATAEKHLDISDVAAPRVVRNHENTAGRRHVQAHRQICLQPGDTKYNTAETEASV